MTVDLDASLVSESCHAGGPAPLPQLGALGEQRPSSLKRPAELPRAPLCILSNRLPFRQILQLLHTLPHMLVPPLFFSLKHMQMPCRSLILPSGSTIDVELSVTHTQHVWEVLL